MFKHQRKKQISYLLQEATISEATTSPKWSKIRNDINDGFKSVRIDISFKSPTHTRLQTSGLVIVCSGVSYLPLHINVILLLGFFYIVGFGSSQSEVVFNVQVKDLTEQFPAVTPLTLVLKQFLADRSLDQSYSGGLSSYCLNYGSLLMDFLFFFGNVFEPWQMRISVQGSGIYINRERGCSIDPLYIDDPLFLTNNVGRNCFHIHQCIKVRWHS